MTSHIQGTRRERRYVHAEFIRALGDIGYADVGELVREVEAVVSQIRFDASALPLVALQYEVRFDGCFLQAIVDVLDRNTGEPLTVGRAVIVPWEVLARNGAGYVLEWTRETIANLFAHEVAECFSYKGERIFNVHPGQEPR